VLLAIDTSTKMIGLALQDGRKVLAEKVWFSESYHTIELAPEVAIIMRSVGVTPQALTSIGVALGPGTFTGLRIGLALAKGMALAYQIPTVGIPTLDILARAQPMRKNPMWVLIQAGRGRIAGLWYKWGRNGWKARGKPTTMTWGELVPELEEPTYICGEFDEEGWEVLGAAEHALLASPALCVRRPSYLAEIALERLATGKPAEVADLVPIYMQTEGIESA
jgi:tRNA threonylcarbamoyladenosine biosynthesis protein TsaB